MQQRTNQRDPLLRGVFKIKLGFLDRFPYIGKGGEVDAGFEFMPPHDLGKKSRIAHITVVKGDFSVKRLAVPSR